MRVIFKALKRLRVRYHLKYSTYGLYIGVLFTFRISYFVYYPISVYIYIYKQSISYMAGWAMGMANRDKERHKHKP